jgi:microcystin-dependent protein
MSLILDGTSGIGISGGTQPLDPTSLNAVVQAIFPTGTAMLFAQTAAPTGWTKSTTHDNKALRVVSGTASSGGTVNFTTAFASKAVAGTIGNTTATNIATTATNIAVTAGGTVNNTTLTVTQIPSHTHTMRATNNGATTTSASNNILADADANIYRDNINPNVNLRSTSITNTGSSGAHNHSFSGTSHNHTQNSHNHTQNAHTHTFTGTAIDLAVQYVDVIIATKD